MLEKISQTKKPIILSSGMSSYQELDESINFLSQKKSQISLLQCTTSYPTKPENYGLTIIKDLKERYHIPIGFSDHSGKISPCIAAVALGAEILEFHVAFSKEQFGPDSSSSLTVSEVMELVRHVNDIDNAMKQNTQKEDQVNRQRKDYRT